MLAMIGIVPTLVVSTIMATVVWMRYRQQRAGRCFIAAAVVQILLALAGALRREAANPQVIVVAATVSWMLLALLALSLLLFFAALYTPEWWQRPRLIGWIALPYILVMAFIAMNNLLGTGLLIGGVERSENGLQIVSGPLSLAMGLISTIGWIPHMALLIRTFIYQPRERHAILVLIGLLIFSTITGFTMRANPFLAPFISIVNQVVLISSLAYLLFQRKIFETTEVVMDQALANMVEGIAVITPDATVGFTNRAIEQHLGLHQGRSIDVIGAQGFDAAAICAILKADRTEAILETDTHSIAITTSPIIYNRGQIEGHLLLTRDVTQSRANERALRQRQDELLQTVEELQKAQASQQSLAATVRSLSLPIIPVAVGVIVMPLIGALDQQRAWDFEQRFLEGIQQHQAYTAVLDLTGVPPIDQDAASVVMRAVGGAKLLGAQTILVGIRPEIAQSIVALGMSKNGFATALTLQDALDTLLHRRARPANGTVRAG
ncbi:MAG TPA: STAS domain-containing protein [Herpetosiphonaceae bacterium]